MDRLLKLQVPSRFHDPLRCPRVLPRNHRGNQRVISDEQLYFETKFRTITLSTCMTRLLDSLWAVEQNGRIPAPRLI